MRNVLLAVTLAALALWFLGRPVFAQSSAQPPAYVLIVHPNNQTTEIDRRFVEDAFLKKVRHWPSDEAIRPADQLPNSAVRRKFTEDVLQRSVEAVKVYWQQRIFSGRDVPPPELGTDEEVVDYVLRYEGGVGYVSAATNLKGTKALTLR